MNDSHPSAMSEADKAALMASDPSAFDNDDPTPGEAVGADGAAAAAGTEAGKDAATGADAGATEAGATTATTTGAAAAAAATDVAAAAGTDAAATTAAAATDDSGKPGAIPKERFNEVVGQRNQAEALARSQAAELAQLREKLAATTSPKDFAAEFETLLDRFDKGEIEMPEYEREKNKLQVQQFEHISTVNALKAQETTTAASIARSWDEEVAAWAKSNPGFLEGDGNAAVFQRALDAEGAFYGNSISATELLRVASVRAFQATGYTPPAGAQTDATTTAAADAGKAAADTRRQANAQAAATGSGTPPLATGGVGERGGPSRTVDLTNLKPGTFSQKLTKAEQEAMLGEGAV